MTHSPGSRERCPPTEISQQTDDWDVPVPVQFLHQDVTPIPRRLKHLILVLEGYARRKCFAWPSDAELMKKCGVKRSQIQDMLVRLEADLWIKRIRITKSRRSRRIILLLKRIRDKFRLHIFDPQSGLTENQIRDIVRKKIPDETRIPEVRSEQRETSRHLSGFPDKPFVRFSGHGISTNSSEQSLKTTTTEKAPQPSSSFPNSSPKKPKSDEAALDALAIDLADMVKGWSAEQAKEWASRWLAANHDLDSLRNALDRTIVGTKRKHDPVVDVEAYMSRILGRYPGGVPPIPKAAVNSSDGQTHALLARLKAIGWLAKLDGNGRLVKTKDPLFPGDPAEIPRDLGEQVSAAKAAIVELLSNEGK
jgi:DNA-binding MarR family transcriptional regulator